jgi:hypothetical protein
VGGERVNLAWHGTNHTPDNSYIHFPDHDTLMLVDIFLPRWVPFDSFNLNEDVPGSIAAPDTAMAYAWKHFIGGHMGRLGTRADMVLYQQSRRPWRRSTRPRTSPSTGTTCGLRPSSTWPRWSPTPPGQSSRSNLGVLAAADVYTASTTFAILESVRLDLGVGSQVHA